LIGASMPDRSCAARRDDVATLAVHVQQQGQVGAAVRVVFEALDLRRDAILVALEIDEAIVLLVAAALVPDRDVAVVVAARTALLVFDERGNRSALVQVGIDDLHHGAATCRRWLYFDEGHIRPPPRN